MMNYKKEMDTSWFQIPVKNMLVKNGNFPQIGVKIKKMKPPPRYIKHYMVHKNSSEVADLEWIAIIMATK